MVLALDLDTHDYARSFDVTEPEVFTGPEWTYFDTHRPAYELDIISRVNTSDFLYLAQEGTPVGGVHGPSVLAFIQYTPNNGTEEFVRGGVELGLIPYLQTIKGFQRARE